MNAVEEYLSWSADKEKKLRFVNGGYGIADTVVKRVDKSLRGVYEQLRSLQCPHLPIICSIEEKQDCLEVIERYIDGRSLQYVLDERGAQTDEFVLRLARQIAQTLSLLHSLQPPVIHRDIKPQNIMQCGQEFILIDFDAARRFDRNAKQDTTAIGTHGYAAPEQYGFAQTDARSDIFSLGVTLYEMRMGAPYQKGAVCDGMLGGIIAKCTQFDADKRYKSAEKLLEALTKVKASPRKIVLWRAATFAAVAFAAFALGIGIGRASAIPSNEALSDEQPSPSQALTTPHGGIPTVAPTTRPTLPATDPKALLNEAVNLYHAGQYDDALAILEQSALKGVDGAAQYRNSAYLKKAIAALDADGYDAFMQVAGMKIYTQDGFAEESDAAMLAQIRFAYELFDTAPMEISSHPERAAVFSNLKNSGVDNDLTFIVDRVEYEVLALQLWRTKADAVRLAVRYRANIRFAHKIEVVYTGYSDMRSVYESDFQALGSGIYESYIDLPLQFFKGATELLMNRKIPLREYEALYSPERAQADMEKFGYSLFDNTTYVNLNGSTYSFKDVMNEAAFELVAAEYTQAETINPYLAAYAEAEALYAERKFAEAYALYDQSVLRYLRQSPERREELRSYAGG